MAVARGISRERVAGKGEGRFAFGVGGELVVVREPERWSEVIYTVAGDWRYKT